MAAGKGAVQCVANVVGLRAREFLAGREALEYPSIARDHLIDRLAGDVEHRLISTNAGVPQPREVLGAFDGPRVKQPITTRRVRRDRKVVTRGIGERDIRVRLYAQIATGRRLAIEGRGKYAMLDRHPFGPAVEKDVESAALPRCDDRTHLVDGELDGEHDPTRAEPKDLRGAMLVHHVYRIIGDDVAAGARELGHESQMAAEQGQPTVEPLGYGAPFLGTNDRRRTEPERNAATA